jgi:hypothetical protein
MKQRGLRHVSRAARSVLETLVEGLDGLGASKKVDNAKGAFMAVCVERVEESGHGPIFSVAHYFEQNGDLVPDPDVTFLRDAAGDFYPLDDDGSVRVNRAQQADLAYFAANWTKNIRQQQGL